jgi:serine kinase of HPr protein (carbohydrate metabolism regulator)
LFFHCSAIAVDGKAYLFTAPSGTGKSTHTRLWREMLGERAVMVNDDKPFVRFVDGKPFVYGSPWNGKHRLDTNIAVPIAGICFLEQAPENAISLVSAKECFPRLCRQIFYSTKEKTFERVVQLAGKLASCVPFYALQCNISREAAKLSFETMTGEVLK